MKMNLKFKQLLLLFMFLIATAMVAVFIYDLFYSLDPINFSNATNNLIDNQILARDVNNVTSTPTSSVNDTNSTMQSNTRDSIPSGWVIAIVVVGSVVAGLAGFGGGYYYVIREGMKNSPQVEMELTYT